MVEKEIKKLLQFHEFTKIKELFEFEKAIVQINHYYHSDEIFNDLTIRIREINHMYKLQVKVPRFVDSCLHIKEEYEESVNMIPEYLPKEKIRRLTGINITDDVIYIGKLETERFVCREYEGVEVALDKNTYLGKIDYEIELEYDQDFPKELLQVLQSNGIVFDKHTIGKNKRFLARLKEVNNSGDTSLNESII